MNLSYNFKSLSWLWIITNSMTTLPPGRWNSYGTRVAPTFANSLLPIAWAVKEGSLKVIFCETRGFFWIKQISCPIAFQRLSTWNAMAILLRFWSRPSPRFVRSTMLPCSDAWTQRYWRKVVLMTHHWWVSPHSIPHVRPSIEPYVKIVARPLPTPSSTRRFW